MDFKYIIAIIAFFVISNLFKKASKQVQSNRMPSFGGSDDGEGPMNLETTEVEYLKVLEESKQSTYSFSTAPQDESQNQQEKYQSSRSGFTKPKINESTFPSSKKKDISQQVGLNPNQAIHGMMWSEVFGPPRSKKPYKYPRK